MSDLPLLDGLERLERLERLGGGLESLGRTLVERVGPLNLWTALLLAGSLLVDRLVARRARASWRVALYAPVGLRVLLPLDWSLGFASSPRLVTLLAPILTVGAGHADDASTERGLSWYALAACTYLAVAVLLAVRAVRARVRLGRALAGASPVSVAVADAPCSVVCHDELGPMAVGAFLPRIVLPRHLLGPGQERALACVLRHEAAHVRRGDAWLLGVTQTLAVVAWPVAPLWIAIARVRQLVELACDEAALAGADAIERRSYGHALLDLAHHQSFAVAPLGAGELHFGSTLRARIAALAPSRQWPLAAQAVALFVTPVALLAACGGRTPAAGPAAGDDGYGYQFDIDSPRHAAAAPAPASIPAGPNGRIAPELIQAKVRARFGAIGACYQAGLKKDPKLTGTVNVKSVVGMDGTTKEAVDAQSTLPDKDVVACVVGEFGKITYPAGSGTLTIVYPVELTP